MIRLLAEADRFRCAAGAGRNLVLLLLISLVGASLWGCAARSPEAGGDAPDVRRHEGCSSVGTFFPVDKEAMRDSLPVGFVPREGAIFGPEFDGRGVFGVAAWWCPANGSLRAHSFLVVASLVEPPKAWDGSETVAFHWYEHVRLVDDEVLYRAWRAAGLTVVDARIGPDPLTPDKQLARLVAGSAEGTEVRIGVELDVQGDFPGQSLLFWHDTGEQRVYSHFEFEPHRSWVGEPFECSVRSGTRVNLPVDSLPCPAGAVTEVIRTIDFTSSIRRPGR